MQSQRGLSARISRKNGVKRGVEGSGRGADWPMLDAVEIGKAQKRERMCPEAVCSSTAADEFGRSSV